MRREVYFLAKTFLLLSTVLLAGVMSWTFFVTRPIPPHYDPARKLVEESAGYYRRYDTGERDALQHIAAQMRLYPNAQLYAVHFDEGWVDGQSHVVTYDRDAKQLIRGEEFCGCGGGYAEVTNKMLQSVAAKRGGLSDFEKLGGVSYP